MLIFVHVLILYPWYDMPQIYPNMLFVIKDRPILLHLSPIGPWWALGEDLPTRLPCWYRVGEEISRGSCAVSAQRLIALKTVEGSKGSLEDVERYRLQRWFQGRLACCAWGRSPPS